MKERIFPNYSINAKSDLVLGILAGRPYSARKCPMSDLTRALMRLSYSSAPDLEIELREIMDRLIEDKYAKATNKGMYQITAKGVVFKEAGGYTRQKRKKQRKQSIKYLLLTGTWLAALATLGLLISELLKHYHKHLNHIWPSVAMVAPSQGFSNIPVCSIIYIMLSRINKEEGYCLFKLICGDKVMMIRIDELPCAEATWKLAA